MLRNFGGLVAQDGTRDSSRGCNSHGEAFAPSQGHESGTDRSGSGEGTAHQCAQQRREQEHDQVEKLG